jgi:hypothetical protein
VCCAAPLAHAVSYAGWVSPLEHSHDPESSQACQLLTRCLRLATLEDIGGRDLL